MGLREKVALVVILVVLVQINNIKCMPRSFKKDLLQKFSPKFSKNHGFCPAAPSPASPTNKAKKKSFCRKSVQKPKQSIRDIEKFLKNYKYSETDYGTGNSVRTPFYSNNEDFPESNYPLRSSDVWTSESPKYLPENCQTIPDLRSSTQSAKQSLTVPVKFPEIQYPTFNPEDPFNLGDTGNFPKAEYPLAVEDLWYPSEDRRLSSPANVDQCYVKTSPKNFKCIKPSLKNFMNSDFQLKKCAPRANRINRKTDLKSLHNTTSSQSTNDSYNNYSSSYDSDYSNYYPNNNTSYEHASPPKYCICKMNNHTISPCIPTHLTPEILSTMPYFDGTLCEIDQRLNSSSGSSSAHVPLSPPAPGTLTTCCPRTSITPSTKPPPTDMITSPSASSNPSTESITKQSSASLGAITSKSFATTAFAKTATSETFTTAAPKKTITRQSSNQDTFNESYIAKTSESSSSMDSTPSLFSSKNVSSSPTSTPSESASTASVQTTSASSPYITNNLLTPKVSNKGETTISTNDFTDFLAFQSTVAPANSCQNQDNKTIANTNTFQPKRSTSLSLTDLTDTKSAVDPTTKTVTFRSAALTNSSVASKMSSDPIMLTEDPTTVGVSQSTTIPLNKFNCPTDTPISNTDTDTFLSTVAPIDSNTGQHTTTTDDKETSNTTISSCTSFYSSYTLVTVKPPSSKATNDLTTEIDKLTSNTTSTESGTFQSTVTLTDPCTMSTDSNMLTKVPTMSSISEPIQSTSVCAASQINFAPKYTRTVVDTEFASEITNTTLPENATASPLESIMSSAPKESTSAFTEYKTPTEPASAPIASTFALTGLTSDSIETKFDPVEFTTATIEFTTVPQEFTNVFPEPTTSSLEPTSDLEETPYNSPESITVSPEYIFSSKEFTETTVNPLEMFTFSTEFTMVPQEPTNFFAENTTASLESTLSRKTIYNSPESTLVSPECTTPLAAFTSDSTETTVNPLEFFTVSTEFTTSPQELTNLFVEHTTASLESTSSEEATYNSQESTMVPSECTTSLAVFTSESTNTTIDRLESTGVFAEFTTAPKESTNIFSEHTTAPLESNSDPIYTTFSSPEFTTVPPDSTFAPAEFKTTTIDSLEFTTIFTEFTTGPQESTFAFPDYTTLSLEFTPGPTEITYDSQESITVPPKSTIAPAEITYDYSEITIDALKLNTLSTDSTMSPQEFTKVFPDHTTALLESTSAPTEITYHNPESTFASVEFTSNSAETNFEPLDFTAVLTDFTMAPQEYTKVFPKRIKTSLESTSAPTETTCDSPEFTKVPPSTFIHEESTTIPPEFIFDSSKLTTTFSESTPAPTEPTFAPVQSTLYSIESSSTPIETTVTEYNTTTVSTESPTFSTELTSGLTITTSSPSSDFKGSTNTPLDFDLASTKTLYAPTEYVTAPSENIQQRKNIILKIIRHPDDLFPIIRECNLTNIERKSEKVDDLLIHIVQLNNDTNYNYPSPN